LKLLIGGKEQKYRWTSSQLSR